jgi:hypothetical protein
MMIGLRLKCTTLPQKVSIDVTHIWTMYKKCVNIHRGGE